MRHIKKFGLLGTGVIGAGWAARVLHFGYDVIAYDIDSSMQEWLDGAVQNALPKLQELTKDYTIPSQGTLHFTTDIHDIYGCDFIQENVPENLDIKRAALKQVADNTDHDVIIASSTSGFMPSDLQEGMAHPERFIVGHPFNPVYLIPLVEIVGGQHSSVDAKEHAKQFYERLSMHALMVKKEVAGHISDRLQEAMWREILHSLNDGIATTRDLDESISYGPGLRWAIMGMNQIYMMAGGKGGARHFIKQFGPALEWDWTYLKAPPLSDDIIDAFANGTEEQAEGKSVRELEMIRDECLVAIQHVLAKHNVGAGTTLNNLNKFYDKK